MREQGASDSFIAGVFGLSREYIGQLLGRGGGSGRTKRLAFVMNNVTPQQKAAMHKAALAGDTMTNIAALAGVSPPLAKRILAEIDPKIFKRYYADRRTRRENKIRDLLKEFLRQNPKAEMTASELEQWHLGLYVRATFVKPLRVWRREFGLPEPRNGLSVWHEKRRKQFASQSRRAKDTKG